MDKSYSLDSEDDFCSGCQNVSDQQFFRTTLTWMITLYNFMYYSIMLYSWRFSHYSVPIDWLVHGHMTSNNETVTHQMPWVGNIVKTMMSNGKQFTVTHEMLTTVALDRWNLSAVFKFCFCFVLLYNKSLNDWSLGEQWILFPSNLNVSRDEVEGNIEILGKQYSLFPLGPVIKC